MPDIAFIDLPASIGAGEVAGEEAARIARYIRSEVDAGRRSYGDFLILTRKKKGLRPYVEALESLQVPIEVSGAGAFGESAEVRELALLLNALADPQDAVALVGVLRGPLFGLSDPELFAFRQAGGHFSIFADAPGVDAEAPAAQPVARALESLRLWFKWTRMLPAGAALERILEDSGYLAMAATSRGGVEAGDLLHAVDRVRAVVEKGFTLADAAEALASWSRLDDDEAAEESAEVDSLPLEPGRRDVVRLMNLHKAKGLEAEVVFLADPLGGFEPRVDVRIVRDTDGGAVGYFKIVEDKRGSAKRLLAEPAGWSAHDAAEQSYLTAEVDRLLYVAATRARDTLVVGRFTGKSGNRKPAWAVLIDKMPKAVELTIPSGVAPPIGEPVDLSARAAASASAATISAHEQSRTASWSTTSVTAETKRLPHVSVEPSEAPNAADPTRPIVPDTPSHRADVGMAWGVLVHGLLEHAMRHKSATRDDLRRLAMWLTVEEPRLRGVIEQALDTVETVSSADFWKQAQAEAESHEEVPFAVRDDRADGLRVVTGAIDLVHRAGDAWQLIDYKTDVDLGDPDVQRRYEQQVQKYAAAWTQLTNRSVATTIVQTRQHAVPSTGEQNAGQN